MWQSYSRVPLILKLLCAWYSWKYVARLGFEPLKFLYSEFFYNTQAASSMVKCFLYITIYLRAAAPAADPGKECEEAEGGAPKNSRM